MGLEEVNYSVMDLEVSSGQVEDTDVRVSLSRFKAFIVVLGFHHEASTLLRCRWNGAPFECGAGFRYPRGRVMCSVVYESAEWRVVSKNENFEGPFGG